MSEEPTFIIAELAYRLAHLDSRITALEAKIAEPHERLEDLELQAERNESRIVYLEERMK
jgi:predicted  nucleic acid-binding Zn-ribbon protein